MHKLLIADRRRRSRRLFGAGEQLGEAVVDAGDAEVGLALEGAAQVVDAVGAVLQELDDGEDVGVGFVERVEDFVAGDGDAGRAADPALDLDEAEATGGGVAAFDVVAESFELAVGWLVAKAALDRHYDHARAGGRGLRVGSCDRARFGAARHRPQEAQGDDEGRAEHDGRPRRDLALPLELGQPLRQPLFEAVGAAPRLGRVEAGVGLSGLLVQLELFGAVVPVGDLEVQPFLDGGARLVD